MSEDGILTEAEEDLVSTVEGQKNAAYKNMRVISLENLLGMAKIVRKVTGICAELRSAVDALTEESEAMREALGLIEGEEEDDESG